MSTNQDQKLKLQLASQYLSTHVTPIIDLLISDLLTHKPSNVIHFASKWFQDQQLKLINAENYQSQPQDQTIDPNKLPTSIRKRRKGILETKFFQQISASESAPKSEYGKSKIFFSCAKLFMFKSFGDEDMKRLVEAVVMKELAEEEMLWGVGDQIDGLYIVNSGELIGKQKGSNSHKVYGIDSMLGELSLLHSVKSTSTITATKPSTIYKVPKSLYNSILNKNRQKHREHMTACISQTIFRNMSAMEKAQLASIMVFENVSEGTEVPRLDEDESRIIIVENGRVQLVRRKGSGEVMKAYSNGDHIQEDTIDYGVFVLIARTDIRILAVRKTAFARMFGAYERFLIRQKVVKKSKSKVKQSRFQ